MKNSDHTGWQNSEFGAFLNGENYEVLEYFKSDLNDENNAIIAFNMEAKITFINLRAENLFVQKGADVIGDSIIDVFRLTHAINMDTKHAWDQLMQDGLLIGSNLERAVKLMDDKILRILLTGSPMFDKEGFLVGGVFYIRENYVN